METPTQSPVGRRCDAATDCAFNPAIAGWLAQHCADTYQVNPTCYDIIDCPETDIRACTWAADGTLTIAFRGTVDLRNWFEDFDGIQTGYPSFDFGACRVHLGFWQAWQSIRENVYDAYRRSGAKRVFITGHSLGGALAALAADRLRRQYGLTPTVYTFGQPRVGNANFAAMYDLALRPFTWRVIHANDIVPRVPWLMGGYRHCGQEAFYDPDANGTLRINPPWWMKLPCDISNAIRELREGKFALLADHHIDTYLALFK